MMPAPNEVDTDAQQTRDDVTRWFFKEYLGTWITAGATGASPTFITDYWSAPLWVSVPGMTPGALPDDAAVVGFLDGMQTRLRAAGYTHTVVPDRRVTAFNDRSATIEVIWSRRRADESEVERLAVHFAVVRRDEGWRIVAIFGQPTTVDRLDEAWPITQGEGSTP